MVAVRDPVRYKKSSRGRRHRLVAALYWAMGLAAAAVLIIPPQDPVVESWPFPDRYSCQVRSKLSTTSFLGI